MREIEFEGRLFRLVDPEKDQTGVGKLQRATVFAEQALLDDMRTRLRPGQLVIDVGANIGNHALFLAALCGCRVLALEPFATNYTALIENLRANRVDHLVEARRLAAGATRAFGRLRVGSPTELGAVTVQTSEQPADVDIVPLDELLLPQAPRAIKIDVERAELEVLQGAVALLCRARPLLYVETLDRQLFDSVAAFVYPLGYRVAGFFNKWPTFLFIHSADAELVDSVPAELQLAATMLRFAADAKVERKRLKAKLVRLRTQPVYRLGRWFKSLRFWR